MERAFTEDEAARHNALTQRGWALIHGEVLLDGIALRTLGLFSRWRLRRAARCFEAALAINPEGWSSMWALGKIEQRRGNPAAALAWFEKAHAIHPDQPDVAREAGLAAMDVGQSEKAVALCEAALRMTAEDAGLLANLALAYCLAGRNREARDAAARAVARNSADEISREVERFVSDVAAGRRKKPERMIDGFPVA
jgi:tetratricopeptide (TPR) repeat protein